MDKTSMSPWFPMTMTNDVRAIGKSIEELSECSSALARCLIQGIYECEPTTKKPNVDWLTDEIADVQCQLELLIELFKLDAQYITTRKHKKIEQMREWRKML